MVQWKGNIDRSQAGQKAQNLDNIRNLEVPNFFVLTKREIGENFSENPRQILNSEIPEKLSKKIDEAYDDIGMSSEVRNASGQARDLVGGQRENQKVSIRISAENTGNKYKLNVGSSNLKNAIKEILSSYYQKNNQTPAIIFQKMIEPDYTGAIITNYTNRHSLIEIVEGLGHSLEEGLTVPEFYLTENQQIIETRIPRKQVKITRNPMNGQRRTRNVSKNNPSFQNNEIEEITSKANQQNTSLKFAYKRGTFYIVDAFQNQPLNVEPDLEALKVSEGEIRGKQGEDYKIVDKPQNTEKPQVAKKGGYTTQQAQKARKNNIPAVFSLKNTEKIQNKKQKQPRKQKTREKTRQTHKPEKTLKSTTATEIRSKKEFPQLSDNPFNIQDSQMQFAETCEEILAEKPELIDGRNIREKALTEALENNPETRVLALKETSDEILQSIIQNNVQILVVPEKIIQNTEQKLLRAEKRFILENIRE